ncbi:MAG: hypothetical protein M3R17_18070 [Bacteroidota bacterium]|nr:hypothetical protein [Bacteroidota bacterium]
MSAKITADDSIHYNHKGFFLGGYLGIGSWSTMGTTREAVELTGGVKQLVFTARFYRSKRLNKYFFENAILAGWKKEFPSGFHNSLSAGYADLAFEHDFYTYPEISRKNFDKRSGLILEEKVGYRFHKQNKSPGVWGIALNYYCIFNEKKPIHGWSVGLDWTFDYLHWNNPKITSSTNDLSKTKRKKYHNDLKEVSNDSIKFKYRIRANFITGILFSPHLDFEHWYSKKWGWGAGVFFRPVLNSYTGILRSFENPDFQLKGGGFFLDWMHYKAAWKNDHYWTFGLRCGYRNLSGRCAIGSKILSPDYYVKRWRQDIVTALRVSFVMPPRDSHWALDWYFTIGARTSFYKTQFPDYTMWNPEGSFTYPKTGCYVLPEFNAGLEVGFGW